LSRRATVAAFLVLAALGLGALALAAADAQRPIAYSQGVPPSHVAAVVAPGQEVCQTPIDLPNPTDAVSLQLGTDHRPGIPFGVIVRDSGGRPIARAANGGGYVDGSVRTVRFREVRGGQTISLCLRNTGRHPLLPYGSEEAHDSGTIANGRKSPLDMALTFLRPRPRSLLSQVPDAFRRAALFRFDWVGPELYWVLGALLVLLVPGLLVFALARAQRGD
jgi:hypothetical protein